MPFTFDVEGEKYEMPAFDKDLYQPEQVSLAEAAKQRARLGREGFEFDGLLARFGDMQLAIERHLTDDSQAPVARAIAQLIESSADHGYKEFFDFFQRWIAHDGSEVDDLGEASGGSQES